MAHSTHTEDGYKKKNTLLAKIVIGLILIAFIFTGVQSYITSRGANPVIAQVGSTKIHLSEFERLLQQALHGKDAATTKAFLKKETIKAVLEQKINEALLNQEVFDLKLVLPDDVLKSVIRNAPNLDPAALKQHLMRTGQSEKNFMARLRLDLVNDQLRSVLFSGLTLPKNLQEAFITAEFSKRSVKVHTLTHKDVSAKISPTDAELQAFLNENKESFMVPEMRDISVLKVKKPTVKISEKEAKAFFDQHPERYQTPEMRDVAVLTLNKDETFNSEDMTAYKDRFISLGTLSRDMVEAPVAAVLFNLKENTYSEPQASGEERKVYHVQKITPAEPQIFEQVKKSIIALLKKEAEARAQKALIQKIDDDIAGGETFENISHSLKEASLKTYTALTQETAVKKLGAEKAEQAFSQNEGEEGQIHQDKDGHAYALQVTKIQAQHLPSFETLKKKVANSYSQKKRAERAFEKAQKVAHSVNKTGKMPKNLTTEVIQDSTLSALKNKINLSQKDLAALAELQKGKAMAAQTSEGGKVIFVTEIKKPEVDENMSKQLEHLFKSFAIHGYQASYFKALREKYPVKVDEELLETLTQKMQEQFS